MNETHSITFAWTPWSASVAVVAVVVMLVVGLMTCRRSGWRKSTVMLESLRLVLVVFGAILLGGPEWTQEYRPEENPIVAVLWDDSGSMETRDVVSGRSADSEQAETRRDAIKTLTNPDTWKSLQGRAQVLIEPFSKAGSSADPASRQRRGRTDAVQVRPISNTGSTPLASEEIGTDLSGPLIEALKKHNPLLGVVIASDGDWNQGDAPIQVASRLRAAGVPVFAFPIGSDARLPDVELLSFDVPTFAIAGKRVRIPLTIDSSLPRDHIATITMKVSGKEEVRKEIRVSAMGRTAESIDWEPSDLGTETLTLSVSTHATEIRKDNNELSAPIAIREEKLNVLVIESYPRWEYRYLRNALSRDPGVEVSCLLFHPSLDKRGGGNSDYIRDFPATKEELARYDVVFIGDVGLDDGQLTVEQCDWLKGLVQQQASGLVFVPGLYGRQFSLLDTSLGDLIPVVLDEAQPNGWGSRTPQHFELTELGRRSLLTKLADTPDENLAVWSNLPGFQWHAPVLKAKPGTETLSVHQETSNRFGRLPLLVTRTFGAGKVLFMGTDGAWRWRKGVEDVYHYRFWGQVVRWMAYRRNMAQGETMRLYYSPERPQVRQTLAINTNVMESSGEPLSKGTVTLRILEPSNQIETVRLKSTGGEWGEFAGRYTPSQPGLHRLNLFCEETGDSLETTLFVQGIALEQVGKPARPEVLEEIARVTRGQVLNVDRVNDVKQWLASMPDPAPAVRRISLWSHPLMVGILVALMTLFWIGRKGAGLI